MAEVGGWEGLVGTLEEEPVSEAAEEGSGEEARMSDSSFLLSRCLRACE